MRYDERDFGALPSDSREVATWQPVYLEALRIELRERLGEFAQMRAGYELRRELDPDSLTHRLTTQVLARVTGPRIYTASEQATATAVGFATWWDMCKATYRGRWWMRWRRWNIRYVQRSETKTATVRVEAELAVLFPHAADLPDRLGNAYPVILRADRC